MKQQVRIIGGRFRGKKLSFPEAADLRPTTDRIKETLFNWLMHDIRDSVCLDAFAGSGALGLEAYSRGAKRVYFVESSSEIYTHLKHQVASFSAPELQVYKGTIQTFLKQISHAFFDIIFYDPPFTHLSLYESPLQDEIFRVLKPQGLLYLESPTQVSLNVNHWTCLKQQQAGQVIYGLYQKVELLASSTA
jgi:16S rRNA (guanine966-N2)-methyltransferase